MNTFKYKETLGARAMKCMFNPEMQCTVCDGMKELETDLKPYVQDGLCQNVLRDSKDNTHILYPACIGSCKHT